MILPAQHIARRCNRILSMIDPFHSRTVRRGMSFGLGPASYDIRCAQDLTLTPGKFSLASSVEKFNMPQDVLAQVCDKSSWARRGIAVQNTIIDPGWSGYLTMELANHGDDTVYIMAGDPIAQIIFMELLEPTDIPYVGKYNNQEAGPQPAREERTNGD